MTPTEAHRIVERFDGFPDIFDPEAAERFDKALDEAGGRPEHSEALDAVRWEFHDGSAIVGTLTGLDYGVHASQLKIYERLAREEGFYESSYPERDDWRRTPEEHEEIIRDIIEENARFDWPEGQGHPADYTFSADLVGRGTSPEIIEAIRGIARRDMDAGPRAAKLWSAPSEEEREEVLARAWAALGPAMDPRPEEGLPPAIRDAFWDDHRFRFNALGQETGAFQAQIGAGPVFQVWAASAEAAASFCAAEAGMAGTEAEIYVAEVMDRECWDRPWKPLPGTAVFSADRLPPPPPDSAGYVSEDSLRGSDLTKTPFEAAAFFESAPGRKEAVWTASGSRSPDEAALFVFEKIGSPDVSPDRRPEDLLRIEMKNLRTGEVSVRSAEWLRETAEATAADRAGKQGRWAALISEEEAEILADAPAHWLSPDGDPPEWGLPAPVYHVCSCAVGWHQEDALEYAKPWTRCRTMDDAQRSLSIEEEPSDGDGYYDLRILILRPDGSYRRLEAGDCPEEDDASARRAEEAEDERRDRSGPGL